MNKKIISLSFLLGFAVLLSGCTLFGTPAKTEDTTATPAVSATPTLSQSNSVNSIEADLKATTIQEEDFSDIK